MEGWTSRRLAIAAVIIIGSVAVIWWIRPDPAPPPPVPVARITADADPLKAEALRRAVAAVEAEPHRRAGWVELGMTYHANGLPALALLCYEHALTLDDEDARVWYLVSRLHDADGDHEAAGAALGRAAAAAPGYAPAHWRLGEWRLDMNDRAGARAAFDQAIRADARDVHGWVGLARVALRDGDAETALARLDEALRRGLVPNEGMYEARAMACRLVGRGADAADAAERARRVGADPPDPWMAELAARDAGLETTLDRVRAAAQGGRAATALTTLDDLARMYPQAAVIPNDRGVILRAQGRLGDALAAFEEALQRSDNYAPAHYNLAATSVMLAEQAGGSTEAHLERASAHLARAIELNGSYAPALALDGELRWRRGDLHGARQQFERAVQLKGDVPHWIVMLGLVYLDAGRGEEAIRVLEPVAQRMPEVPEIQIALAEACFVAGRTAEAARAQSWIEQRWPDHPALRRLRARAAANPPGSRP